MEDLSQYHRLEIIGCLHGLNTHNAAHEILDTQAQDLQNVDLTSKGKVKTRGGSAKLSATEIAGSPTGTYGTFYGQNKHLAASGTNVYEDMDGTPSSIKSALTSDSQTYFEEWDGEVWISNADDQPFRWNGSSTSAITTPPASWASNPPNQIVEHESRLWAADFSASRLDWSKGGDGNDWTAFEDAGSEGSAFRANDGTNITGIVAQDGGLLVFKPKGIWKVTGKTFASFRFPHKYSTIGCVATRTIVNIENRVFFLAEYKGDYGVYVIDDAGGLTHMSDNITTTLNTMDTSKDTLCSAIAYKDRYRLTFPISGGWRSINLYYKNGAWEFDNGNHLASYYNQGGNLYGGSVDSGFSYQLDTGTNDDSVAIDSYFKTGDLTFGLPDFRKKLKFMTVWMKASGDWAANADISYDGKTDTSTYKVPLGTKGSKETTRLEILRLDQVIQGDTISVKFGTTVKDQPFEWYRATIYYEKLKGLGEH